MNPVQKPFEMARPTLAVLFLCVLIAASLWILRPFLPALIWATMVVVATWPLMLRAATFRQPPLAGRDPDDLPGAADTGGAAVGGHRHHRRQRRRDHRMGQALSSLQVQSPPAWVADVPFVGWRLEQIWQQTATTGGTELAAKVAPYAANLTRWFVSEIGSFGLVFVQFLLTVALCAVLYASGEKAATGVPRFGYRLSGERGESAVILAGQAARAVALGVGVTALVQSILGGIGLAIAGVPFAPVLTAVMFMFCIAQLGPGLVLVPAVVWLYWGDHTGWGTFMLIWALFVGTMDNFLRKEGKRRQLQQQQRMEAEFRANMLQRFAEQDKIQQMVQQKRRIKQQEHKRQVQRLWQQKLKAYKESKLREQEQFQKVRQDADWEQQLIRREKEKLLKEHFPNLQGFLPKQLVKMSSGFGQTATNNMKQTGYSNNYRF